MRALRRFRSLEGARTRDLRDELLAAHVALRVARQDARDAEDQLSKVEDACLALIEIPPGRRGYAAARRRLVEVL